MSQKVFRPFGQQPPRMPAVAVDRLGKVIEPGHLVLFHPNEDLIFEVVDVRPVLNPGIPEGQTAVQATLLAQFPVQFLAAMPNRGMVIVGESQARQQAKAAANGDGSSEPREIELTDAEKQAAEAGPDPVDAEGHPHRVYTSRHGSED